MWIWLPAIGVVAMGISCVIVPLRWARLTRRHVETYRSPVVADDRWPDVLVILPCKGQADEMADLEDNLRPVLAQDYPAYRVVFAVTGDDDLAVPVLRRLCAQEARASLVIAERLPGRSEKLGNQLRALQEARPADHVFVFLDSDARPSADLLRKLVAPLVEGRAAVTTGFRWYTPSDAAGFGSWLRAAWNAGGLPFLVDPRLNYAWGGAMAIRREVFEQCGVAEYWSKALSDDLGLSAVVKEAGHRIELVPDCLVRSPEDLTLAGTIEWTTRQTIVCRVYNPVMWRDILVGELITFATLTASAALVAWGAVTGCWVLLLAGLATLLLITCGRLRYQAVVVAIVGRLAPHMAGARARRRLVLLAPAVHPLILFNSLWALVSRKMTWRGVRYHLAGPLDIRVLPSGRRR